MRISIIFIKAVAVNQKDHFINYIKQHNLKWSKQREEIVDIFLRSAGHMTADELFRKAQHKFPDIGYATVYRTLKLLAGSGLVTAARFGHKSARFERAGTGRHHDHMVCTECGNIIEFASPQIERLQDTVARQQGFSVTHHKMVLYGTCRECKPGKR